MGLGFWLLRQEGVPRKALQVFLGREVRTMQFRRQTFSIFDYLWKDIGEGEPILRLGVKSVEEILMAGCSHPLRYTDLRAKLNEVVTASDASETGGGMVYASKLTTRGLRDTLKAEEGLDDSPPEEDLESAQKVVVFDCFAGIGGLSRALDLAKVPVARLVVIEKEKDCRRLNSVRYPGADLWCDIKKVTKKDIEKVLRTTPGATGVIAGGGSPRQGLSLSSLRQHLDDERSKLFYDLVQLLNWVEEIAKEMKLWFVNFVENVVADQKDVEEMIFWPSVTVRDHPCFTRAQGDCCEEVIFDGPLEPLGTIPDKGWRWRGGESSDEVKLPTFTRAIPRKRPPPSPAGYQQCSEETLGRWRQHHMKFPPYTYGPAFLFESAALPGYKRVASASERERLMGFKTGYTAALFKKDAETQAEKEEQEVTRQAALGNSFHAIAVACLVDLWLWSAAVRTDPIGSQAILAQWHGEIAGSGWHQTPQWG
eukprot:Skav227771  [mRNA]  locus=scaffold1237:40424:41934:+ [translate_table: standard]